MKYKTSLITLCVALSTVVSHGFDLNTYHLSATVPLSLSGNTEASGITFNKDNGRLYVVEDEGSTLYELATDGTQLSSMTMTGFQDVEGITYIGGGQFLLAEERLQDVFRFTYSAGGMLIRSSLPSFSVGDNTNNVGLEGISYDPIDGLVFGVKEKTPQFLYTVDLDLPTMTGTVSSFTPSLGLLDLSDVQVLATVPSLVGTGDEDNLLIFSQESALLLEVTRTGTVLSQFSFAGLTVTAEGVTIDENGTIYVCSEDPKLFILTTVPEPSSLALLALAGSTMVCLRRRKH